MRRKRCRFVRQCALLHTHHSQQQAGSLMRIGIWNTAWLGDSVLTLPLIELVKKHFPQADIDFYVRKGFASLYTCHPAIDRVFEFDKKKLGIMGSWRYGRELAERGYSVWISAHRSWRSSAIAQLTRAPIRIGYDSGPLSRLVYTHTVERDFYKLEEIERLLKLAAPLGVPLNLGNREAHWPHLALCAEAEEKAEQVWKKLDPLRPTLGIHPGGAWATKRWPAENMAEVARLAARAQVQIILFGAKNEQEQSDAVREAVSGCPGFIDLAGQLSLPELAACLKRLDCYLSNDSGPMHLSWVQKTPTTAIFGPTVREFGFFPRGAACSVLEVNLPCRPCGLHGHKKCPEGHHACMRNISPRTVWNDIARKLGLNEEI
ncbi:MAG: lipopolysaccharide heptosyltransferase II [Desulfovibrionaceae bacterium]|nr:lipopolysaccharide heptosyltransferase II [Desulfovibrionaceae bacterium]